MCMSPCTGIVSFTAVACNKVCNQQHPRCATRRKNTTLAEEKNLLVCVHIMRNHVKTTTTRGRKGNKRYAHEKQIQWQQWQQHHHHHQTAHQGQHIKDSTKRTAQYNLYTTSTRLLSFSFSFSWVPLLLLVPPLLLLLPFSSFSFLASLFPPLLLLAPPFWVRCCVRCCGVVCEVLCVKWMHRVHV